MPIYDYLCSACDHRADILHGINDPGPNYCPSCGREGTMRKQFAAPAIHYKGSGWAKKDRGASSGTRASRKSSDEAGSAEGKGSDGSSAAARDGSSDGAQGGSAGDASGSSAGSSGPSSGSSGPSSGGKD